MAKGIKLIISDLSTHPHPHPHNLNLQSMVISMYFAVAWEEPRMVINESAVEWRDARTGPTDVSLSLVNLRPIATVSQLHQQNKSSQFIIKGKV